MHCSSKIDISEHFQSVSNNAKKNNAKTPAKGTELGRVVGCGLLSGLAAGIGKWLWECVLGPGGFDS